MARLHHRESQLVVTYSDDDSSDGYDVPPHFSDTSDSDDLPDTFSLCEKDKVYVDDSLPRSISSSAAKKKPNQKPAGYRKSVSDSGVKRHDLGNKGKQTAMVQPIQQAPIVPQHGIVRQTFSTPPKGHTDVTKVLWYHGSLSRHAAEGLLLACGEDGTYLLRDSTSDPNGFSLSVRCNNAVKHFQVTYDAGKYHFGLVTFASLDQFLDHFDNQPLIGGEAGMIVVLKYPYYRDVSEPDIYETATVHTEVGRLNTLDTQSHAPVAITSKSGYLTKLGGRRKNWKKRWFVLFKNELQYFRKPNDKTPLRSINLEKALEVEPFNAGPRDNCIRLVCPERTFYMFAGSKAESDDWLRIIQWKLAHNVQRRLSSGVRGSVQPRTVQPSS